MEPAHVLATSAVLLGLAACVGMALAGLRLAGAPYPPAALAMAHGLAAAAALTLLAYAAATVGIPAVGVYALFTLGAAAGLGAWLNLGFHQQRRPIPLAPMTVHILVAIAGLALLLVALAQTLKPGS